MPLFNYKISKENKQDFSYMKTYVLGLGLMFSPENKNYID